MSAISIRNLRKSYGSRVVLPGLDLDIAAGEFFALLGPNGSGKSTLFRMLATLLPPDSGTALIAGFDIVRDPAAVRASLGVVFQSPSLDKKLTVVENLRYGGALYGLHGSELSHRIDEVVPALRLEEKVDAMVETLSGGQQRRVEIAKCLLTRPGILLLDEPSTGLDPSARMDLWALVAQLRTKHGMTVLFTSHLMDESAKAGRVGILHKGRLAAVDAPDVLLKKAGPDVLRVSTSDPSAVAAYLGRESGRPVHSLESEVRVATSEAHALAAAASAKFPDAVLSVTVSKPTLEDVFLFETGERLND